MKLSIKHSPIGKPAENSGAALTYKWQSVSLSPSQLVQHITSGKPIAVAQYKQGHRKKSNFIVSELIALDYDENYHDAVYAGLIASPFIQQNAFAVIQTASSKSDSRRCRVLFRLDVPVYDASMYGDLVRIILENAPYGADKAAVDPARTFYGSSPGTVADFFNPYRVLSIAPYLAEIEQRKARALTERENRPPSEELPDDYIKAIEQTLGVTGYNNEGWSNRVVCPIGRHEHDDSNPAAAWHKDLHILKCLKCHFTGEKYLAWQIARALGIKRTREAKSFDRGDLSQPPENHVNHAAKKVIPLKVKRSKYADLVALPTPLRKAIIYDKQTNLGRIVDVLLHKRVPDDQPLSRKEIAVMMQDFEMGQSAVYRVFETDSHFLNAENRPEILNLRIGNEAGIFYTLDSLLSSLEQHYRYSIHTNGDLLHHHETTLCSAKEYRQYSLLEYFSADVEITKSGKKLAQEFNLSAGTISTYTRALRDQHLLEITAHYKRHEITPDEFGNLSVTLADYWRLFSNCYIEMYIVKDGRRYECLHKGGKKGIPNNRIPAAYDAVMHFFEKNVKSNKLKTGREFSNMAFVLVSKKANSYRRVTQEETRLAA